MEDLALDVKTFLKKKKDMIEKEEDLRTIEKLLILNPDLIMCPACQDKLKIHHWEKAGEPGMRVPFFKCNRCGFLG